MNIKRLAKRLLCPLQCLRFGIKNQEGNLYIGKACKIVNDKEMRFGKNVSIMPYTCFYAMKVDIWRLVKVQKLECFPEWLRREK